MRGSERYERALVTAARDGDPRAVDQLVAEYLPLVYNVVGRALDGHADVDDVVQETMLRCVTGLRGLRDPDRFRAWLVAIAVRQVRDRHADPYRARQSGHLGWASDPDEVTDPGADFADLTILRLELSGQRREVAEATRWLDPDDRELLSLWWLEASGELTRDDLAISLGLTNQHAAVRVQRMKAQLDAARVVVRALHTRPRCPELGSLVSAWSGQPNPLRRKRLARHARDCDRCGPAWSHLVAAERLLAGVGLVAPAAGLIAAVASGGAAAAAAGVGVGSAGAAGLTSTSTGAMTAIPGGAAVFGGGTTAGASASAGAAGSAAAGSGTAAKSAVWWLPRMLKVLTVGKPVAAAAATVTVAAASVVTFGVLRDDTVPTSNTLPPPPAVVATTSAVPQQGPTPTVAPTTPPPSKAAEPTLSRTTAKAAPPVKQTAKKGAAVWDFPAVSAGLKAVGASWYYNWGPDNDRMPGPSGVDFVPMVWGTANVTDATLSKVKKEGDTLLGFNEPDLAEQANMTPAKALELWPKLEATGMRLGSPAVAWGAADSGRWLDQFMAGAKERGYRVDFIALHWYGADFSSAAVGHLKGYIQQVYAKYKLPIWLTEFALIKWDGAGAHYPSDAQQAAFIEGATDMLQGLSYVERYSWFGLPSTADSKTGLYRESGSLTVAGQAYRAAG